MNENDPDPARPAWWWPTLLGLALLAVLGLDAVTHLGYALAVLYGPIVVLSSQAGRRRTVLTVAGLALPLIVLGTLISPVGPTRQSLTFVVTNRILAGLVVLVSAWLALHIVDQRNRLQASRERLLAQRTQLAEQHGLLTLAGEIGRLGGWSFQISEGVGRWSDEVARIHGMEPGYAPQTEEGLAFLVPDDRERIAEAFRHCLEEGVAFDEEFRIDRADGQQVWVNSIGRAVRDGTGAVVGARGAFQDITARKEAELEAHRRQSEVLDLEAQSLQLARRLTETVESVGDAVLGLDAEWRITVVNGNAEKLMGRDRDDLIGRNVWDEFPEEVGEVFQTEYERAVRERSPVRIEGFSQALGLWLEVSVYPHENGLSVYFRDVSERRQLAEQLAQLQRLDSLGQLTGGVAHDFNNLLTVILGSAEILRAKLHDPGLAALAEAISSTAHRGSELTHSLLAFARSQPLDPALVDVNDVVRTTSSMLERILPPEVEVSVHLRQDPPRSLVDRAQLENAVLNLCINARDAMPAGGRLQLETGVVDLDAAFTAPYEGLEPGHYLVVSVTDDGDGIDSTALQRVFEPFFTTKAVGAGSGLGLAMVYGFVKQSGGHVDIVSATTLGTTVTIYLPAAPQDDDADPQLPPPGGVLSARDGERILVVEDDAGVRRVCREHLTSLGYDVLEAADASSALRLLADRDDVDLVFTDLVMPGSLSGLQLGARIEADWPGRPVIYTSGYASASLLGHRSLVPGVNLLRKPYSRSDLANTIRAGLDRGHSREPA